MAASERAPRRGAPAARRAGRNAKVRGAGPALRLIAGGAAEVRRAPAPTVAPRPKRSASVERAGANDALRLLALVALLAGFGLVMVLSSSSVVSIAQYGSPWSLFERQVMWTVLGLGAFVVATRIELARWRRFAVPLLCVTTLLLLAVLAPGLGRTAGGSSRWIGAGPIKIQPSEFAKLAFVLFAADLVARREQVRDQARDLVRPLVLVFGGLGILIVKQPDLGTAIVLVCITGAVLYAGGVRTRLLATVMGAVVAAGSVVALSASYRRDRLLSFVNPFAHASTTGYQVVQSLVALGAGHLTGVGFGGSATTYGLLPNAQTDFVFAVVGNELGLFGGLAVLAAFAGFAWLGLRIAGRAEDRFASLLAAGITCWVVGEAFINIGGVTGILPETGIPLPFLSAGGSSLVVALAATGLLVNVARHPRARPAAGRVGVAPQDRTGQPRRAPAGSGSRQTAQAGSGSRQNAQARTVSGRTR